MRVKSANMSMQDLYRKIVPIGMRYIIAKVRLNKQNKLVYKELLRKRQLGLYDDFDSELEYMIQKGTLCTIPYDFVDKYNPKDIQVLGNRECRYVMVDNKKMYFPSNYSKRFIQIYMNSLLQEQDLNSPHYYDISVDSPNGRIFIDGGGAEGYISLLNIEQFEKVYIVECDTNWITALRKTFEPWKEKVVFIDKYLGDSDERGKITLDQIIEQTEDYQNKNFVIKLDIEGAEKQAINGLKDQRKQVKELYVCTYHCAEDGEVLSENLEDYICEFSSNYMYFGDWQNISFRHGVLRAKRNE